MTKRKIVPDPNFPSPMWTLSKLPCQSCKGAVYYSEIGNGDHEDYVVVCSKCGKRKIEEGADA